MFNKLVFIIGIGNLSFNLLFSRDIQSIFLPFMMNITKRILDLTQNTYYYQTNELLKKYVLCDNYHSS